MKLLNLMFVWPCITDTIMLLRMGEIIARNMLSWL